MKRLAVLIILGLCALPGVASVPVVTGKTKANTRPVLPNPLPGQPAMQIPPTIQRPFVETDVLVECTQRIMIGFILGQIDFGTENPSS